MDMFCGVALPCRFLATQLSQYSRPSLMPANNRLTLFADIAGVGRYLNASSIRPSLYTWADARIVWSNAFALRTSSDWKSLRKDRI